MFMRKIKERGLAGSGREDVLERVRRERSSSPMQRLVMPATVLAIPAPPSAVPTPTPAGGQDESTVNQMMGVLWQSGVCTPDVHPLATVDSKLKYILSGLKVLVENAKVRMACLGTIQRYEAELKSLIDGGPDDGGSDRLGMDELVKRAYFMVQEADRQYRNQAHRMADMAVATQRRKEEVRQLRAKIAELEDSHLKSKIEILREKCNREVGVGDREKISAIDTLIGGFQEAEKKRILLQKEIVRLKAIVVLPEPQEDELSETNLFVEITELREIVKEFQMDKYRSSINSDWEIRQSIPRCVPPVPMQGRGPFLPDIPSPAPPVSPEVLCKWDTHSGDDIDYFQSLSRSFTDELIQDSQTPQSFR